MTLVYDLREEVRLRQNDQRDICVIDLNGLATKVGGLEHRSVSLKQSLVVAQVVGIDLEIRSEPWNAFRPRDLSYA